MRIKEIEFSGKPYIIKEMKVKDLREKVVPKVLPLMEVFKGSDTMQAALDRIPELEEKLAEVFPGLTAERIDDAYPSEIEGLVAGFIDVNFLGLKTLLGRALSLKLPGTSES